MNGHRIIIFLYCWLLCSCYSLAQSQEIILKRYSTANGLADNSIRSLCFDSKGFLWIGTEEGLTRFDGEEFINYNRITVGTHQVGNVLNEIVEDEEGWLWVATQDGGICRFNTITNEIFRPQLITSSSNEQLLTYTLALFPNAGMMVGTDKGIYYSADRKSFTQLPDTLDVPCYKMLEEDGKIITAEARNSSRVFDENFKCIRQLNINKSDGPHFLNTVFADTMKRFWLGAWDDKLYKVTSDHRHMTMIDLASDKDVMAATDEIMCITEQLNHQLWLGTKKGELWQYNTVSGLAERILISPKESGKLYGNKIYCMLTDKYHRTWIGTNNGLHVYDRTTSRFDITYVDDAVPITSFLRQGENLYIGGLGGFYKLHDEKLERLSDKIHIYSMASKNANEIWLGTQQALMTYSTDANRISVPIKNYNIQKLDINQITSSRFTFLQKHKSNLFVNIYGYGLMVVDSNMDWFVNQLTTEQGGDNLLNGMFQDSKGRLWLMGSLTGLMLCNTNEMHQPEKATTIYSTWKNKLYSKGLRSKQITSMVETKNGDLLVGTLGGGLYRFDPTNEEEPFSYLHAPYQSIRSMIKDDQDRIWMIASGTLLCYDPYLAKWKIYDEKEGIPKEGLQGKLFKDINGTIYASGNGFFLSFNPMDMVKSTEIPRTKITHVKIMDQSRDDLIHQTQIDLPYHQNFITIQFSSLCYSNAGSSTFFFMLKGLDKEWRDNNSLNSVTYSALPPGEYEFLVKAVSAEGIENEEPTLLKIVVHPAFYETWWFIGLMGLLLIGIVYAIIRYRNQQRAHLELVRNKIARDLHDDIGSALGSISFFSETAKRTLGNQDRNNTAIVLDKIGSTSREMIENMHDIVWAVNPRNDSFDQVLLRMKNYSTDLCAANNIRLSFSSDDSLSSLKLSMTERKNLFLIFKETLYNSIKYANCTHITVQIGEYRKERLRMTIQDNGAGFDINAVRSQGNGLRNMKTRAEEMGAKYEIQSQPGSGTTTTVILD
jgi:ligand-binding sensor domain-containing protein